MQRTRRQDEAAATVRLKERYRAEALTFIDKVDPPWIEEGDAGYMGTLLSARFELNCKCKIITRQRGGKLSSYVHTIW
jgi:hypothetical protein